jgi:hypothetical protein
MTTGDLIRLAAGLAAVALVAAPALVAAAAKVKAWLDSRPAPAPAAEGVSVGDMRVVLDLGMRLKSVGCTRGVELVKELLDVMLTPERDKK